MTGTRVGAVLLAVSGLLFGHPSAADRVLLTQASADPFTNSGSQHATEVEPDTFMYGRIIVGAYQAGRFFSGGSSDVGWATSTDGGVTWKHGMLPGLTTHEDGGRWPRASDPSVVYDARYRTWLIAALGVNNAGFGLGVSVSRSADGLSWDRPVIAFGNDNRGYDKDWITCDNHRASPHYGNCYIEADIFTAGDAIIMSTSRDGGATWSVPRAPAGHPSGLGGQPLVQPEGKVIVPFSVDGFFVGAFSSANGGASWTREVKVASIDAHAVAGAMRDGEGLPSAAMDAAGKVYVAWQDCRFRAHCSANDIVLSTSVNGTTWSRVQRIPIDATTSGADHFIPGIGVDPATSGRTAKIGLYFYFFPRARCSVATCQLEVGYVSSANGGATWSAPATIAGPMKLSQLPSTLLGRMVGDYISAAVRHGQSFSLFAVAKPPAHGRAFNEAIYTAGGLAITGGTARAVTGPVLSRPIRHSAPPPLRVSH